MPTNIKWPMRRVIPLVLAVFALAPATATAQARCQAHRTRWGNLAWCTYTLPSEFARASGIDKAPWPKSEQDANSYVWLKMGQTIHVAATNDGRFTSAYTRQGPITGKNCFTLCAEAFGPFYPYPKGVCDNGGACFPGDAPMPPLKVLTLDPSGCGMTIGPPCPHEGYYVGHLTRSPHGGRAAVVVTLKAKYAGYYGFGSGSLRPGMKITTKVY